MQVVCLWCGKLIKEIEPRMEPAITYSACISCYENIGKETRKYRRRNARRRRQREKY